MKKKLLIIPVLILILAAMSCVSFAAWIDVDADLKLGVNSGAWSANEGNLTFAEVKDSDVLVGYRLIGFAEEMKGTTLSVPSEHNGLPVVSIAASFTAAAKNDLIKITIPGSVTTIEGDAFSDMISLQSVVFAGDGLATIGVNAFQRCPGLTVITIPSTIRSIGVDVLASCQSLTKIDIKTQVANVNGGVAPVGFGKKADNTYAQVVYVK